MLSEFTQDSLLIRMPLVLALPWEIVFVFPAHIQREEHAASTEYVEQSSMALRVEYARRALVAPRQRDLGLLELFLRSGRRGCHV